MSKEIRAKLASFMHTEPELSELIGDSDETFRPDPSDDFKPTPETIQTSGRESLPNEEISEISGLELSEVQKREPVSPFLDFTPSTKPVWETLTRTAYNPNQLKPEDVELAKIRIIQAQPFFKEFREHEIFKNMQKDPIWDILANDCVEYCEAAA